MYDEGRRMTRFMRRDAKKFTLRHVPEQITGHAVTLHAPIAVIDGVTLARSLANAEVCHRTSICLFATFIVACISMNLTFAK